MPSVNDVVGWYVEGGTPSFILLYSFWVAAVTSLQEKRFSYVVVIIVGNVY